MKLKFSSRAITRGFAKEFAPDILKGILEEEVQDKTVKDFYEWIDSTNLWDKIQPGQQQFLLSYKPWTLDWLTIDFIIGAIAKSNKTLALLITTSPELQGKLEDEIKDIKGRLESTTP